MKSWNGKLLIVILVVNDLFVIGIIYKLIEVGICVLEEISVMGINDFLIFCYVLFFLLIVYVFIEEMGEMGVNVLDE